MKFKIYEKPEEQMALYYLFLTEKTLTVKQKKKYLKQGF